MKSRRGIIAGLLIAMVAIAAIPNKGAVRLSEQLIDMLIDETGAGFAVFSDSPGLQTPTLTQYEDQCTALDTPWDCCTGNGTGDCPARMDAEGELQDPVAVRTPRHKTQNARIVMGESQDNCSSFPTTCEDGELLIPSGGLSGLRQWRFPDGGGTIVLHSEMITDNSGPGLVVIGGVNQVGDGRSITIGADGIEADAETYTDTKCLNVDPAATVTDYLFMRPDNPLTITGLDCLVDAATSVVMTLRECDANGGSCVGSEEAVTCGTTNSTDTGLIDAPNIEAGNYMRVLRGTVTGSPTQVLFCVTWTWDD